MIRILVLSSFLAAAACGQPLSNAPSRTNRPLAVVASPGLVTLAHITNRVALLRQELSQLKASVKTAAARKQLELDAGQITEKQHQQWLNSSWAKVVAREKAIDRELAGLKLREMDVRRIWRLTNAPPPAMKSKK